MTFTYDGDRDVDDSYRATCYSGYYFMWNGKASDSKTATCIRSGGDDIWKFSDGSTKLGNCESGNYSHLFIL